MDKTLSRTAARPDVARDTEYYLENIGKVKTVDDFLADDRLYRFAMKAHGLEDMAYAKAFMRKVLEEGANTETSFANKLSDIRYREFATSFDFETYGTATTATEGAQQGTVDKYVRQTLEEDTGVQSEGARLALYFERKSKNIRSAYSILADAALLKVVQTAFSIPETTAFMDIDKQAEMIDRFIKVDDLKDSEKLQKFLNRFTALWEAENASSGGVANAAMLFGQTTGFSADLLASLQNLRLGGS